MAYRRAWATLASIDRGMRPFRRRKLPSFDGEFNLAVEFKPGSVVPSGAEAIPCNIRWTFPEVPVRLDRLRIANRHATELVDRLLADLAVARVHQHRQRRRILGLVDRLDAAADRLAAYQDGDGSRRRDVLADLERILG